MDAILRRGSSGPVRPSAGPRVAPFLVRLGIAWPACIAMSVAWPPAMLASQFFVPIALVAIYPAVAPRGRGATCRRWSRWPAGCVDTAGYGEPVSRSGGR